MPGSTVDALNVRIGVNISSLQNGLKKCLSQLEGLQAKTTGTANKIQSSFDGIGRVADKVGKTIAAAFAVNKIIDFGKAAIDAGSDLTEVQNVVDTVFGSMSESINEWSKNAMTAFGLSETSAKRYTSTMGAMLKSSGITGEAMKTMSVNMTSLAADMASFYNLSSDTAFEKIRAGLSGETEPLKQLGINMSVANMEAYAMSQGITKAYSSMSQAEQTILRYNYLLSVTADAQHDFERTSTSWANQTRVLAENINKLKTVIGQGLIQALTPLINIFNQLIAKVIEFAQSIAAAFGAESGDSSGGLSDTAASAGDTADNLESADKAAKKLKNTISGFDELNIISDDTESEDNANDALSNLSPNSVYDSIGSGIDGISEKMKAFSELLKEKLQPVAELAKDIKSSFVEAFDEEMCSRLLGNLKDGLLTAVDIVGAFAESFDKAWKKNDAGTKLLESIGNTFNNILGLANDIGSSIAQALKSDAGIAWTESLIEKWQSFWNMINGITAGLRAAWNDNGAGERYIESIFNKWASLNGFIAAVRNTIAQVFASDVGQSFFGTLISLGTTFNNIVSAVAGTFTKVWNEAGLGQSIVSGIVNIVTDLAGWVDDLGQHFLKAWENNELGKQTVTAIGGAVQAVIELVQRLSEAWRTAWDGSVTTQIFSGVLSTIQNIGNTVKAVANNIKEAFSSTGADTQVFEAIRNAIAGIVSAAQNLSGRLKEAFSGVDWSPLANSAAMLATAISNVVQAAAGLASGVIAAFGEQLAGAFQSSIPDLINAVATALQFVANVMNAINPEVVLRLAEAFVALKIVGSLVSIFNTLKGVFGSVTDILTGTTFGFSQTTATVLVLVTALTGLAAAIAAVITAWNQLTSSTSDANASLSSMSATAYGGTGSASAVSYSALSVSDIPQAATGGIFDKGNLFIANERGPELVGSQNGKSVVMNNEQIVDAVSSGVASAVAPLVDAMQGGTEQTVKIKGNDLYYILEKTKRSRGTEISKNFAFGGAY